MYLPDKILLKVTSTLVAVGVLITVPSILVVVPTILRNALTGEVKETPITPNEISLPE